MSCTSRRRRCGQDRQKNDIQNSGLTTFQNILHLPALSLLACLYATSRTMAQLVPYSVTYSFAAGANNSGSLAANNSGMYSRAYTQFVRHPLDENLRIFFG
jgi:hypothetical protein